MAGLEQKLGISLYSAVLFVIVSLPFTYGITNSISPVPLFNAMTQCPTMIGHLVHTFVFFLISYLSMGGAGDRYTKLKFSLYGTIVYYLLSSPWMYEFVNRLLGLGTAAMGCPTMGGILLHALVYMIVLVCMMYLPL